LLVILSIIVYTISFNFYISVSLVIAIILHELGHFCAAKKLKLSVQGCYLIPYVGGALILSDSYQSYKQQAIVALAGPISGCLLAGTIGIAYRFTGNLYLGSLLYIVSVINICNLLPLSPLDGGQVIYSIISSFSNKMGVWWKSISILVMFIILFKINVTISIITFLLFIPNILNVVLTLFNRIENESLEKMSARQALIILFFYLSSVLLLLAFIVFLAYEAIII
jgi:Zn-dependent protease